MSSVDFLNCVAFVLLACSSGKEDSVFELPPDLYTINKVYDIGNNKDATDLRFQLDFSTAVNLSDIKEARLFVVKSAKSLGIDQINQIPPGNYLPLALSNMSKQVVKPAALFKDSDGDDIANGGYKAYVGILGAKNSMQLSSLKEFELKDQPIYEGNYVGTWVDQTPVSPGAPTTFQMSLRIKGDYTGQMFYANSNFKPYGAGTQDATISMTVSGSLITSFILDQFIAGYKNGCPAKKTLTGHFEDDIDLVLNDFSWPDCDGTRNVVLKFTRQ